MNHPVKTRIVGGIFWSVAMRWSIKFIGLINTIILARLLLPEDFGLVAMAMLTIALLEEFTTVNTSLLLIRSQENRTDHSNTAWTVNIMQSMLVAFLLILLAPYAALYFEEQRVISIIYVLAFVKVIRSFNNVGIILAQKDLNFSLDYRFNVYSRIVTFFSVITFAIILRDYWAIVYGTLVASILNSAISYYIHPFRPSICIKYLKEYVKFALTMIPMAIARLLNNKFDVILVGGNSQTAMMGIYNVSNEIASIFTKELALSVNRGLFPNFSLLADDREAFIQTYLKIGAAAFAVCLPIGVGLIMVSDNLIYVMLGANWMTTVPFMQWLVVYGTLTSILHIFSEHPLIALSMEQYVNRMMWLRLVVLVICTIVGFQLCQIKGIAIGMAISSVITFPFIMWITARLLKLPVQRLFYGLIRPSIAAICMWLFIENIPYFNVAIVDLIFQSISGVIVYTIILIMTWSISGTPDGIEKFIVDKFISIKRKLIN
ncbi:MAG: oligosaccharide flippase family protein [Candidatus Brocadiaceae bacterium]|nr:oligosaccharide flippase family protein [Candidatus Brocadiaceae bacterium]